MQKAAGPGGGGDGCAAHQHFAVRTQFHLAAGQWLADGSRCHVEGVVEGNDCGGFSHAVALHQDKADRIPELFERSREGAAAGDQRPELEAEGAMNVAEAPPAQPGGNTGRGAFGAGGALGEAGQGGFKVGLDQRVQPRHGGQHGDALAADGLNDAGSDQAAFEVKLGLIDGRNPEAHGLAEDVAQRQGVENAQGMDEALVAQIGLRRFRDGSHAGQHIAVGEHDALGIAGGAGGEEDLERGGGGEAGDGAGFFGGEVGEPVLKRDLRDFDGQLAEQEHIAYGEFGGYVGGDAGGEVGGSGGVQRNG